MTRHPTPPARRGARLTLALILLSGLASGTSLPVAAQTSTARSGAAETALPVMARHEGLWCGTFRRFDDQGVLVETFPTEIVISFPRGEASAYQQTNRYSPEGRPPTVIATEGVFDGERIRFDNARVQGWATDDQTDERHRTVLLFFEFKDGSGYFYEAIQLSDDGRTRHRVAQYFAADGALQRRTLIDETHRSGDPSPAADDQPRCEPSP
jgi:hypothetical protein